MFKNFVKAIIRRCLGYKVFTFYFELAVAPSRVDTSDIQMFSGVGRITYRNGGDLGVGLAKFKYEKCKEAANSGVISENEPTKLKAWFSIFTQIV